MLAKALADAVAGALAAGDAKAARVALRALNDLANDVDPTGGTSVIDLDAERGKRGGR